MDEVVLRLVSATTVEKVTLDLTNGTYAVPVDVIDLCDSDSDSVVLVDDVTKPTTSDRSLAALPPVPLPNQVSSEQAPQRLDQRQSRDVSGPYEERGQRASSGQDLEEREPRAPYGEETSARELGMMLLNASNMTFLHSEIWARRLEEMAWENLRALDNLRTDTDLHRLIATTVPGVNSSIVVAGLKAARPPRMTYEEWGRENEMRRQRRDVERRQRLDEERQRLEEQRRRREEDRRRREEERRQREEEGWSSSDEAVCCPTTTIAECREEEQLEEERRDRRENDERRDERRRHFHDERRRHEEESSDEDEEGRRQDDYEASYDAYRRHMDDVRRRRVEDKRQEERRRQEDGRQDQDDRRHQEDERRREEDDEDRREEEHGQRCRGLLPTLLGNVQNSMTYALAPFACFHPECLGSGFPTMRDLADHIVTVHDGNAAAPTFLPDVVHLKLDTRSDLVTPAPFVCHHVRCAGLSLGSRGALADHTLECHNGVYVAPRPIRCPFCPRSRTFGSYSAFANHHRAKHSGPVPSEDVVRPRNTSSTRDRSSHETDRRPPDRHRRYVDVRSPSIVGMKRPFDWYDDPVFGSLSRYF